MAHSLDRLMGTMNNTVWFNGDSKEVTYAERYAMHWENLIRAEHSYPLRQFYIDDGLNRQGECYMIPWGRNECISLYFNCKYPLDNVNYENKLQKDINGYVYKVFN